MVNVATQIDGAVVYWSLSSFFDRDKLMKGWWPLGLENDVPERRAAVTCLKDALLEVFGGTRVLIRPHAAKNGFSVVSENRGADDNTYSTLLTAKVFGENSHPIFGGSVERIDQVNAAFYKHFGRIPSAQMGVTLVKVLQRLGATRLRPSGGIYWLPGSRLGEWQSVMAAVEDAADGGIATGYSISHSLDRDSIKAVHDALLIEVNSEAARLTQEIQSGDLGERAIKSRKQEAALLQKKVGEYERLLGVGLEQLRETLDRVEQTNAVAALLLSANPFEMTSEANHVFA